MTGLLELCRNYLLQDGYVVRIPPISRNLPGLRSDFSHKTAATKAGLGWVGKSALFISPEFGSGLRLATVLTDAPLITGTPTTESRCGTCAACVDVCPYGALRGTSWHPGIERDELLDAVLCSEKREEFRPALGYKHPCGLCIQACPFGKGKDRAEV
jgi:epoxyqueuosine reductase QueG